MISARARVQTFDEDRIGAIGPGRHRPARIDPFRLVGVQVGPGSGGEG
jgi:hypothetical protein